MILPRVGSSAPLMVRRRVDLPAPVGTDDAIAVTWGELEVDVLEKDTLTELYGEVADCDHIASGLFLLICLGMGVRSKSGDWLRYPTIICSYRRLFMPWIPLVLH